MSEPFLVLGATGRIGQAMRRHAPLDGLDAVWQSRLPSPGYLAWDILAGRCPEGTAAGVVMCLAGVIHGTAAELALNTDLALAACSTAQAFGAPHVFLASLGSGIRAVRPCSAGRCGPCPAGRLW